MKHKKLPLFFLGILIIGLFAGIFIQVNQVKATTTYNWVKNAGFEDAGGNLIVNGGFETGDFSNWTTAGSPSVLNTAFHSGVYSAYVPSGSTILYNLTTSYKSISDLSFWAYASVTHNIELGLFYSDSSYVAFQLEVTGDAPIWHLLNFTGDVDVNKVLTAFRINPLSSTSRFDDVVCFVTAVGQTVVSADTLPWWSAQNWDGAGIDITDLSHSGTACYATIYGDYSNQLVQNFDYLNSTSIMDVSLWAWTTSPNVTIRFTVIYSDRSWSFGYNYTTSSDGWKHLKFTGFILPNRYVVQIQLSVNIESYTYLDDISVLSTIPVGKGRFSFALNPEAISRSNITFIAIQNQEYVFTGFIYDDNGLNTESGTYSVMSSKGIQSGNINAGIFDFIIAKRYGLATTHHLYKDADLTRILQSTDTSLQLGFIGFVGQIVYNAAALIGLVNSAKQAQGNSGDVDIQSISDSFTITCVINSQTMVFKITADFFDSSGGTFHTPNPYETDNPTLPNTDVPVNSFVTFLIYTIFLFGFPFAFTIYAIEKAPQINPLFVFFAGFNIMCIVGIISALISLWVLVVAIIIDIVFGLYMFEHRGGIGGV